MIDPFTVAGGISAAASLADRFLKMPTEVVSCRYEPATKTLKVKLYSDSSDVVVQVTSEDFKLGGIGSIGSSLYMRDWVADKDAVSCRIRIDGVSELTIRADPAKGTSTKGLKLFIATKHNARQVEAVCE